MVEVAIREDLWQEFTAMARQMRRRPQVLAETVLREYLQRKADEELLASSARSAQKTDFRMEDSEEVVRRYRRRNAGKPNHGRTESASSRRR